MHNDYIKMNIQMLLKALPVTC